MVVHCIPIFSAYSSVLNWLILTVERTHENGSIHKRWTTGLSPSHNLQEAFAFICVCIMTLTFRLIK